MVGAVLLVRAGGRAKSQEAKSAAVATISPEVPAAKPVPPPAAKKTPSPAAAATSSREPATRAADPATAPRPRGPYTIEVASHGELWRAIDERDRLQELTGLDAWVALGDEERGEPHRIVLGVYRSYTRAKSAADMLVRSKTLGRATVVSLPPRGSRR